jgi:hypothetical protein
MQKLRAMEHPYHRRPRRRRNCVGTDRGVQKVGLLDWVGTSIATFRLPSFAIVTYLIRSDVTNLLD